MKPSDAEPCGDGRRRPRDGSGDLRGALLERARRHSAWYRRLGDATADADAIDADVRAAAPAPLCAPVARKSVCFERQPNPTSAVSALARYFDGMALAPPPSPSRSPSEPGDDSAIELDDSEDPLSPKTRRVRSSLILEAQCVAIPECDGRKLSLDETGLRRTRFVRTPSVIVSDYSEDCGHSDFFRRRDSGGSDCSLDSSCSNLNSCCGSQISILDGELGLQTPDRKASDCSSCSTLSGNEEDDPDSGLGRTCPRINKIAVLP